LRTALLVGNSDGIGLATTRRLLSAGWGTIGISRSASPIDDAAYRHHVCDVTDSRYPELIAALVREQAPNLCVYFAGIGEFFDPLDMTSEPRVFDVNLMGMVRTVAAVLPPMVRRGDGHFIGVSSFADELVSPEAPSYFASKAGFSNYLAGLRLALKSKGVNVTNIRFGFVDTKMAKGALRPFMMSVERAADHVEYCIRKRPARYSAPRIIIPFLKVLKLAMRLRG
jgi:short-subunit dehydrogenase